MIRLGFLSCCVLVLLATSSFASDPGDIGFSTGKGRLPIVDAQGRELILQGLNGGSSKHSFMRRAYETEADVEFQAKQLGYNTHRYLIFWDHVMPEKGVINTAYLDDIESRLQWFSNNNMQVILDMHQDNWGEQCGGNGSPAWATFGTEEGTSGGAPWWMKAASPCVVNSFNNFWWNTNNIHEDYAQAWKAVAERFNNNPAVLGYDIMNEPTQTAAIVDQMMHEMLSDSDKTLVNAIVKTTVWINGEPWNVGTDMIKQKIRDMGSNMGFNIPESYVWMVTKTIISRTNGDWGTRTAVREYESGPLSELYQRVINSIREVDSDNYIFFEPFSLGVNNGFNTFVSYMHDPRQGERRLGYIPHMYPRDLHEGGAYNEHDYMAVENWERNQSQYVYENNLAWILGEFGHSNTAPGGVQFLKDTVRMLERNQLGWEYWESAQTSWAPFDKNTLELMPNAEALVNIYPRAVAGKIENYTYNREEQSFVLSYESKTGVTGVTEISIPASVYSNGFVVESSDITGNWNYSFDSDAGILSVNHDPAAVEHTITVKPSATSAVSSYRELLDRRAGKCLNINGRIPADGLNVMLYECAGKNWQSWAYDEENQFIRNYQNTDYCLTHFGSAEAKDGGAVALAKCSDSDDHRWIVDEHIDGNIVRNIYNTDIVLDAYGTGNFSNVGQWTFNNSTQQRWRWGWKDAHSSMNEVVSDMRANGIYDMKIWSKAGGCGLEYDGSESGGERNAKFDCASRGDSMTFNSYTDPVVNPNGTVSISGSIFSSYSGCGLEWDGNLDGSNERNAKFDCAGSSDPVTITTTADREAVVLSSNSCGFEWSSTPSGGENNAKWDCHPRYDGMKLHQVEPQHTEAAVAGSGWSEIPAMRQLSVAEDGSMWATDSGSRVYRWNGSGWDQISGYLVHVSVGFVGEVWGVNSSDNVYRYNGSGWTQMPGKLRHVSVGADGTVWGVNANDNVYRWHGSGWTQVSGLLRQVSVGSAGEVWGVNASNNAYRWNGSSWTQLSSDKTYVSAAADGTVWAVSSQNRVYTYVDNAWLLVDGHLTQVSVGSATQVVGAINSGGYKSYLRDFD